MVLAGWLGLAGSVCFGDAGSVTVLPDTPVHLGRSAQVAIDATARGDSLSLQFRRPKDNSTLAPDEVTVSIDGKSEPVTRTGTGFSLSLDELHGEPHQLDIIVAHDGIREILSERVSAPQPALAASLWRDHKQLAWWVLNIVIVLIAAIAISRRKG